jgi:DNA invertase Pin-like site-specific DNA recombinase
MKYVAYCRKSTDEKDKQVLSIDQQISELKEFALKENLEVVEFLTEKQSAKIPGRPVFDHLVEIIESGVASGIVSWNPDRLARNSVDGGRIIYLLDLGKLQSLKFPTHWFENTPQGRFMLSIAFGQAKYYVDNLSQNVHRGLKFKIKKGIWPARAPMGYRNDRNAKNIVIYEQEAKVIKKAFELYSTGNYSLADIGQLFLENGIKNRISGGTPNGSNLRRLLMRPFYTGYMVYKGELYQGTHESLISKELFDKVQLVVKQRGWHHQNKSKRYNFPFTGLMKCAYCQASITAEHRPFFFPRTNNRVSYIYYHCTKKKGPCCQKGYTRQEIIQTQFQKLIESISLSEIYANKMLEFLGNDIKTEKEQIETELKRITEELTEIDQKLDRLLEAYLDAVLESENYKQKKNELTEKQMILKGKIQRLKEGNPVWIERMREFIKDAHECEKTARAEKNCHELKLVAKKVGSKYFLKDHKIEFFLLPPFQALAALPFAASATLESSQIFPLYQKVRNYFKSLNC